ncbi:hypothetical protein DFP72DRAFT_1174902 [Ephemerocybe angulata]|uniref:Uncharacterized protein n=1 Tax=Ephemerocybe angulata TaxID=980116 RepID=A0A8H6M036_9AGAR|nr:hypothetical protein DFP72DRAFT_1174902 [Tulosesus angulatus]
MTCQFNSSATPDVERQYLAFLGNAGGQVQEREKVEKSAGNNVAPKSDTDLATRLGVSLQPRFQSTEDKHDLLQVLRWILRLLPSTLKSFLYFLQLLQPLLHVSSRAFFTPRASRRIRFGVRTAVWMARCYTVIEQHPFMDRHLGL